MELCNENSASGLIASGGADDCIRIFAEDSEQHSSLPVSRPFPHILSVLVFRLAAHQVHGGCLFVHRKVILLVMALTQEHTQEHFQRESLIGFCFNCRAKPIHS